MCLGNAQHLAQQKPPAQENHRRAKIDRQIFQPVARRRSNRAIKCPGCAVNRNRQGIDRRVPDPGMTITGPFVAPPGNGVKQPDIKQRNENHQFRGQHFLSPLGLCRVAQGARQKRAKYDQNSPAGKEIDKQDRQPEYHAIKGKHPDKWRYPEKQGDQHQGERTFCQSAGWRDGNVS